MEGKGGKKNEWSESKRVSFDPGKEMESPRFRAIIRATSGRKKRGDVKSFSHELNCKEHHQLPLRKLRGVTTIDELMNVIRLKFSRLKQEVDSELGIYAGDLISILERSSSNSSPNWRSPFEDLLVIAQKCAEMSSDEFWSKCEGIVQTLDDKRQELPTGTLKQAHTRILFILTRCTRLLQFQKEGAFGEDEHALALHQLSDLGVYTTNEGNNSGEFGRKNVLTANDIKERLIRRRIIETKNLSIDFLGRPLNFGGVNEGLSPGSRGDRISSWKKLPGKNAKREDLELGSPTKKVLEGISNLNRDKVSRDEIEERIKGGGEGVLGVDGANVDDGKPKMICRICEFEIPTQYAEGHFKVCTMADRCDSKGLTIDQRLHKVSDVLNKILIAFRVHKGLGAISEDSESLTLSLDGDEVSNSNSDASNLPQTPMTIQANQLLNVDKAFTELENFQQIESLLNIARGIESIGPNDYNSLEDLSSYLEDLNAVIDTRKVDALVVETFGKRVAKLLQEKFIQLCGYIDDSQKDTCLNIDEENSSDNNSVGPSARAAHLNSKFKERTTIEDFEIIKPISRGAFGRVFLAKKRVTGDLFAIKVLKKADMIRKNAVESILAERNILISARNPFVVRFFYSFTCRENLYLVMEYLNGGDLYSLLRNLGCLDEDMARTYIAEVVLALEYLHSLNVIHRDLKPDNLLISRDGHIKLTDFGLSKVGLINSTDDLSGPDVSSALMGESPDDDEDATAQRAEKREQRRKQTAVGTPDYLAPEILLGMQHGPSADWWSVGIILFELLVGIPPFNAEHPQRIFDNIMNRDIPWPHVPEEMSHEAFDLVNKFLIENPLQRLGATGAQEVKAHPFFRNINWDMLARQKAQFIPSTDDEYDTSYFTSRQPWGAENLVHENINNSNNGYDDVSDSSDASCCSSAHSYDHDEEVDECGSMEDFASRGIAVKYSFSNFSFKNISQLASMNYDLITKHNEDPANASKS
ncbi:hypothetical protein LUZ60_015897 [Juncus effusus]|nr:hypothetical protein LUZ60_015897 [Juncus effusus]